METEKWELTDVTRQVPDHVMSLTHAVHLFVLCILRLPFLRLNEKTNIKPSFTSPRLAKYFPSALNATFRMPEECSAEMESGVTVDASSLVENIRIRGL